MQNSIFFNFFVKFWICSANFWWIFFRISRQIPENSDVCRFFNQICENKSEICRKLGILWKLFIIFQNYSLHSLGGAGKYDMVMVDCFSHGDAVPEGCRSATLFHDAKLLLRPDGVVVQNIWSR